MKEKEASNRVFAKNPNLARPSFFTRNENIPRLAICVGHVSKQHRVDSSAALVNAKKK